MKVSLVVATLERPDALAKLFATLAVQTHRPFEVIVVDQSGADAARQTHQLCTQASFDVRYLHSDRRGLSLARNLGLAEVSGDLVGFPDDDCWYAPDLLASVVAWFQRYPNHEILSVPYTEPGRRNPRFPVKSKRLHVFNAHDTVASVGLFFRSGLLKRKALRFRESIGAGTSLPAAEEVDILLRALRAGGRGRYDPSIEVFHAIERESVTGEEAFIRRERAATFVLAANARSPLTIARLAVRVARTAAKALRVPSERPRLRARLEGVRIALAELGRPRQR